MDKFFERHKLQKLTQEEIDYLNSLISTYNLNFVVKSFSWRKLQVQMALFIQPKIKEIIQSLPNSSRKLNKKEAYFPITSIRSTLL